jgi:muramoyltetrapeptide carboxypeptidase LdcA involved in peptidoglycan recycling
MSSEELYKNPVARVRDIHAALRAPDIEGIIATIGGYESIRLLPHLSTTLFRKHPKIILGGSDATTYLLFARRAGIPGFYGPSVMAGFSQLEDLPSQFREHLTGFLFGRWMRYRYVPSESFTHGYTGWSKDGKGGIQPVRKSDGPRVLQGTKAVTGHLWGGCIEVLEFLKATKFWPPTRFFDGVCLFFETSEEKPSPDRVGYMLRNYGVSGILGRASALLLGRPKDYTDAEQTKLEELVMRIVRDEFENDSLTVISRVDIGHTDPKWIIPLGATMRVDPTIPSFELISSPFS